MVGRLFHRLRFRDVPRMLFVCGAGLTAITLAGAHEVTVRRTPRPEALLFPPIAAPTPKPVAITPAPVRLVPPQEPQREYHYTFAVEMPVPTPGLKPVDFSPTEEAGGVKYRVVRAEYIRSVSRRENKVGADVIMQFDQSGSIASTDPSDLRIPAGAEFAAGLPTDVRVAVISFPSPNSFGSSTVQQLQDFTLELPAAEAAIRSLQGKVGGGTPLTASLHTCIQKLAAEPAGRSRLLLSFGDGTDDEIQNPNERKALIQEAHQANVKICFVMLGLPSEAEVSVLREVAHATGGEIEAVSNADRLRNAFRKLASSVVDDRSYYRLTIRARRNTPFLAGETLGVRIAAPNKAQSFALVLP